MQQKKQQVINIAIVSSIILFIISLIIYVGLSAGHNLFNTISAESGEKLKVSVTANHIVGKPKKGETRFLDSTPLEKTSEWINLFSKGFAIEQQTQAAKPIMFGKDVDAFYYAYHFMIVSENKEECSYQIKISEISDPNIEIVIGSWTKDGFKINTTLRSGKLKMGDEAEIFVVVLTAKPINQIKKAAQNKDFNIDLKISK